MQTTSAIPADVLTSWLTGYRTAATSPILSALRLAASDIDALARQVADRCAKRAQRRTAQRKVSGLASRGPQRRR